MKLSLRSLLYDLIFQDNCPICNKKSYWKYSPFCLDCWNEIKPLPNFKITTVKFHQEFWKYVDSLYTFAPYEGTIKEVIHYFKYCKIIRLGRELGKLLSTISPPVLDILIPVPLHSKKIKTREFNQTAILAKELSKSWKIKLELEVLIKIKDTADQASLDVNQRKSNVKNAYYLKKEVKDLNIGLIDDVVTTGSTLIECAKVLKKGGAKSIHAFTLARVL